jgi:hypothetical protein
MNKNNFRVYHDLDQGGRLIFMPHGMDQTFGIMMVEPDMPISSRMQGLVARAVLEVPEGRRRFLERLSRLNSSVFDARAVTNRIRQWAAAIRPVLIEEVSPSHLVQHQMAVAGFCERVMQRKQSLDEQLARPGTLLAFDDNGVAKLRNWNMATNYGSPRLAHVPRSDGQGILHISAAQGSSIGSWRTRVVLEEGEYAFEGKVRTRGVVSDPGDRLTGAALRIPGHLTRNKLQGSCEWTDVVCEFVVPNGSRDIELICELRAAQGEAWFDAESLQLIRK